MVTSTKKFLFAYQKVALGACFAPRYFVGQPTKGCIAKEAPLLTDEPGGLGGKTYLRVHR